MEERFYKVRLSSGRVLGPMDLQRIKLFISKDQIQGVETARSYPSGEWKDINSFPEIAEILMQKVNGTLKSIEVELKQESYGAFDKTPQLLPKEIAQADEEATRLVEASEVMPEPDPAVSIDADATQIIPLEKKPLIEPADPVEARISTEKTAMLSSPSALAKVASGKLLTKKKKLIAAVALVLGTIYILLPDEGAKRVEPPFKVEMPLRAAKPDAQLGDKHFKEGLLLYTQDTVEGYKKSAKLFLKAAGEDPNNVRVLCLLASSYMNLIDVVPRDQNYFNTVTQLIEMARAKNLDIAETVIADVELYHVLGNPDAAINRIVEFSKGHQWGVEMLYYLSLSFYIKGDYPNALNQLNKLDPKNYFSPKIHYLFGLIYDKNGLPDQALKYFQEAVARSPKHVKAHEKLAELYFHKDNLPESGKHAEFVIANKDSASGEDLANAYYFHARLLEVGRRNAEALADLDRALKITPENQDILLEYYTLKAKTGTKLKEAQGKAQMFHFMALGEKALKDGDLDGALAQFVSAREAQFTDPVPLIHLAEIYGKKGDLQASKRSYEKAHKLDPKRASLYPKYIKSLIDSYEFDEAEKIITLYKELSPPEVAVDRIEGDLYSKKERYQEAQVYYKRALAGSNSDSSIYVAYANLMFKTGNFRDSAFYYGLSQRFDPFNAEATLGIGKSLAEIESVEKGVEYVQNALRSSPHKAMLLNGIAEIYAHKGDYQSAIKFADNALTVDASYALAHKTKGDAYAAQDKFKEAMDSYLTYANLAPLDPTGRIERYKLYMKKLDLKAAKAEIQRAIEDFPKYPGIYYLLGELYKEGQNYASALEAAKQEIANNSSYLPAYVLAGSVYNLNRDYHNALNILNKAIKASPDNAPALLQAGIANHNLKSYAAAQSLLERALSFDQGNPEIHKRLGILYFDLGQRDKGKQRFRSYLDLYPNAPDRADVEKLIGS